MAENIDSGRKRDADHFWLSPAFASFTLFGLIFLIWGSFEQQYYRELVLREPHQLNLVRGLSFALIIAGWSAWFVFCQRRRWEKELRRSRRQYETLLTHITDAVILFDQKLIVREWNPGAEAIYGYARREVLGKTLPMLDCFQKHEFHALLDELQRSGAVSESQTQRTNRAGDPLDLRTKVYSLPDVESGENIFLEIGAELTNPVQFLQKVRTLEPC